MIWNEIVCLGDSITYGARDEYGRSYPAELSKILLDKTGDYVPEIVKEYSDQIFDPYHGDGIYGKAEEMVGTIGSYFIPATGIIKGTKLVSGLARNAKLINSSAKTAQITLTSETTEPDFGFEVNDMSLIYRNKSIK